MFKSSRSLWGSSLSNPYSASGSTMVIFLAYGGLGTISDYLFHYRAWGHGSEERSTAMLNVRRNGALKIAKEYIVCYTQAKCAVLF